MSCFKILQVQSEIKERTKGIPETEMFFPKGYVCAHGVSADCPLPSSRVQANPAEKSSGIQWTCEPERQDEQCLSQPFPPLLGPREAAAALVEND